MGKLRIVIADDNERMLQLLEDIIRTDKDMEVVGKAENGEDAAKVVKDYQSKGIMTFLIGDVIEQCADAGVKALAGKIATGDLFVGDSETKAAIEAKCAPDCVEMEGAAVSQIAAKNDVPCVILRAMSDNADEDGHEVLVVKKFSITEYVATATKIVAAMVESL